MGSIIYCAFIVTYFLINEKNNSNLIRQYQEQNQDLIDKYQYTLKEQLKLINYVEKGIVSAINNASKSVVGIYVVSEKGIADIDESTGSGFIIDKEGYIVTNYHVVKKVILDIDSKNNKVIIVKMYGGRSFNVYPENIYFDPLTDIAIFKIDSDNFDFPIIGNSDNVKVGEEVVALGNPLGLFDISFEPTATKGIVSARNIDFGLDEDFGSVYKNMIQTDASINPGNSGGPLLNKNGEVIGINTFVITGSEEYKGSVGLNFAIPINRAINIIEELKKYGKIDRRYNTGIEITDINEVIKKIWNPYLKEVDEGVIIIDIEQKSAGEQAGLKKRDVILKLNGKKIVSVKDYENKILEDEMKAGDYVELLILRNNETKVINLELEKGRFND
tara:strand:+ start:869 stop:2032 length:1164 start_codon:yes stop_codon:yes gene_type:complete